MVRIRAERRTNGSTWLWWLGVILLVLVALYLVFFFADALQTEGVTGGAADTTFADDTASTFTDDTTSTEGARRSRGQSITNFRELTTRTNATALIGRRVEFDSVLVTRVYNDSTVLVRSGQQSASDTTRVEPAAPADTAMADQMLVIISEDDLGMRTGETERETLREGQMISLEGRIRRLSGLDLTERELSDPEVREIAQKRIYVEVEDYTPVV